MYFGVEGSRIDRLARTRNLLQETCERLPKSIVARQVDAINAIRDAWVFKDVCAHKVVRHGRGKAAKRLLTALNVNVTKQSVSVAEAQSHLRLGRFLRTAVRAFCSEDNKKDAHAVTSTIAQFLANVKAPRKAAQDLREFEVVCGLEEEI